MKQYEHWIDGRHQPPACGEWIDTVNPYTGKTWARIPRGTRQDAERAVQAAKTAMFTGPWSSMSATARGKVLRRIGDLIASNAHLLAEIETRDNGKLLSEMRGQLTMLPDYWYYYAGLADKIEGAVMPIERSDFLAFTTREPVGVVAALTAWNSPLHFLSVKCAPALAAGCAVVVKPSEFASASSLELAVLTKEAGLPDGVLNVVAGYGNEVGAALVEHKDVAKITFTGSDVTGARIYERAARGMKRVAMELGGKSPNIVFEDADLDAALVGAISGIFGGAGQMCTAGSRLLVQNSIKERFTERLVALAKDARIGDPMDLRTNIGPIATPPQYAKILEYIDIAKRDGARCVLGGESVGISAAAGNQLIKPTIFTDVASTMRIAQEEVFGPVLSIIGFDDEPHAVEIANDVIYGLAAGVWTSDMGRAIRMTRAIKAGTIWVNTYRAYSFMMPFGGMKMSGVGRENGIEAIHEFLETRSVLISTSTRTPDNPFIQR